MIPSHTRLLIIGGGIHGTTLAVAYLEQGGQLEDLLIVDANAELLANWKRQTSTIEMTHLRSTRVHHVSSNPHALKQFASRHDYGSHHFKDRFGRPSLAMFNDHCEQTIKELKLATRFIGNEAVQSIERKDTFVVQTTNRRITAETVIVSTGQSNTMHIPDWANLSTCRHVFSTPHVAEQANVTVVGGGITALHYTLARINKGHHVTLVTKRPLEVSQFDADRSFMGPKGLRAFHRLGDDWREKRAFVKRERKPGSSPNDLVLKVKRLILTGQVRHLIGETVRDGDVLYVDGQIVPSEEVVCCTGIRPLEPIHSFLRPLLEQLSLPLTPCGTPVLDDTLAWTDGLYMTGPYADLVLGPFARAIYGGQEAARRIVPRLFEAKQKV
ncbi:MULTISPECIES: FAD-dependent oxidoreductase [Exiguobacterium]|uniref:FAD-dependent oxidoreductase n=1 Tax=Exiguobacterium TaxID=33986 RepID=UPI001BE77831|nr:MULTISPECIES: FAD-dependent oxidoreductase [Exiguobacterium]MCT4782798.1 NAD(P)-binding domain-containing protein [Exiguobacterium himgiriensis]